ncbi:tyrosine-type recombinase/integrase [Cellulomonas hominis]
MKWRLGGTREGAWQAESFSSSEHRAQSFREDVETAGHQWPDGWVRGHGYVVESDEPPPPEPTFAEVAEAYFVRQEARTKRGKIKDHTLQRDRRSSELHLTPTFGAKAFIDIEADDIEAWIGAQLDAGAAPKTIRNWHGLLAAICGHGQKVMKLRPDLPSALSDLPELDASEARQIRFYQHGEWALLRGCLKDDVRLLADTLLATGARWGEATALRVGDATVNATEQTVVLLIRRAWSQRATDDPAPIDTSGGETKAWKLGPPKNKRARFAVLTGDMAVRLTAHLAGRDANEYIFTTRGGAPWRYPEFFALRWKPARLAAEKLGLTKHALIHMLRHSFAVWSLSEGVPIQLVSEALGHASIKITWDVYGGVLDLTDPAVARAMAASMMLASRAITPSVAAESTDREAAAR